MLLVQIYLSHFSSIGLVHLLVVLIFFSGRTFGYVNIYMRPLQPSSPLRQQYLSTVQWLRWVCHCTAICSASTAVITPIGGGHYPGVSVEVEHGHFSCSLVSKASWMAFTAANWLHSSYPAVSVTCHVGSHTAAFHIWRFPTMRQDPSVNKACCFLLSASILYSGA